jgi:hypothetical protein
MIKIGFPSAIASSNHAGRGIGFYTKYLIASLQETSEVSIKMVESRSDISEVDVMHYPTFDFFKQTLKIDPKKPTVVTIHDVTPLLFPNNFPPGIKGQINLFFQKRQLQKASKIITDSDCAKKDITKVLKFPDKKTEVVYLAQAEHFRVITDNKILQSVVRRYHLPESFALFTDLLNITQACIDSHMPLVLVGKSFDSRDHLEHPEMASYRQFINVYANHPLIHILGFVEDHDLVAITNLASMLV